MPSGVNENLKSPSNPEDVQQKIQDIASQGNISADLAKKLTEIAESAGNASDKLKVLSTIFNSVTSNSKSLEDQMSNLVKCFNSFEKQTQSISSSFQSFGTSIQSIKTNPLDKITQSLSKLQKEQKNLSKKIDLFSNLDTSFKKLKDISKEMSKIKSDAAKGIKVKVEFDKKSVDKLKNAKITKKVYSGTGSKEKKSSGKSSIIYTGKIEKALRDSVNIQKSIDKTLKEFNKPKKTGKQFDNIVKQLVALNKKKFTTVVSSSTTEPSSPSNKPSSPSNKPSSEAKHAKDMTKADTGKVSQLKEKGMKMLKNNEMGKKAKEETDEFIREVERGLDALDGKFLKLGSFLAKGLKDGATSMQKTLAISGAIVGNFYKNVEALNRWIVSQAELNKTLTISQQSLQTFSGMSNQAFQSMGNSLNLNREQLSKMGDIMSNVGRTGINSIGTVEQIASNLKDTLGKVDMSALQQASELLNSLPSGQIDVLFGVHAKFDDQANLLANLDSAKLDKVINLQMKGAFGNFEGGIQLNEKDKSVIQLQEQNNKFIDDIHAILYDCLPQFVTTGIGNLKLFKNLLGIVGTISGVFAPAISLTNKAILGRLNAPIATISAGDSLKGLNTKINYLQKNVLKIPKWLSNLTGKVGGLGKSILGKIGGFGKSLLGGFGKLLGPVAIAAGIGLAIGSIATLISKAIFNSIKKSNEQKEKESGEFDEQRNLALYGKKQESVKFDDYNRRKSITNSMAEKNTGKVVGATAGAIIGSFIPGLGTLIGGMIGAGLGSLYDLTAGYVQGSEKSKKQDPYYQESDIKKSYSAGTKIFERALDPFNLGYGKIVARIANPMLLLTDALVEHADTLQHESRTKKIKEDIRKDEMVLQDAAARKGGDYQQNADGSLKRITTGELDKFGNKIEYYLTKTGQKVKVQDAVNNKKMLKQLIELQKITKRIELIEKDAYTSANKQRYETAKQGVQIMAKMGGSNQNSMNMINTMIKEASQSHKIKTGMLSQNKERILKSDMTAAQKAAAMQKAVQTEIKAHQDLIAKLEEAANAFDQLPSIVKRTFQIDLKKQILELNKSSFLGADSAGSQNMEMNRQAIKNVSEKRESNAQISAKQRQAISAREKDLKRNEERLNAMAGGNYSPEQQKKDEQVEETIQQALSGNVDYQKNKQYAETTRDFQTKTSQDKYSDKALDNLAASLSGAKANTGEDAQVFIRRMMKQLKEAKNDEDKKRIQKRIDDLIGLVGSKAQANATRQQRSVYRQVAQKHGMSEKEVENASGRRALKVATDAGKVNLDVEKAQLKKAETERNLKAEREAQQVFIASLNNVFESGSVKFAQAITKALEGKKEQDYFSGRTDVDAKVAGASIDEYIEAIKAQQKAPKILNDQFKSVIKDFKNFDTKGNQQAEDYKNISMQLAKAMNVSARNPEDKGARERIRILRENLQKIKNNADESTKEMLNNIDTTNARMSGVVDSYLQKQQNRSRAFEQTMKKIEEVAKNAFKNIENRLAQINVDVLSAKSGYTGQYQDIGAGIGLAHQAAKAADTKLQVDTTAAERAYQQQVALAEETYQRAMETAKTQEDIKKAQNTRIALLQKSEADRVANLKKANEDWVKAQQAAAESIRKKLSLASEALSIQKDLLTEIGAPFEMLLGIEQEIVRNAQKRADNQQDLLNKYIHKYGPASIQVKQQELKTAKAQAEVIKASFGAQRNALEKLTGTLLGTFDKIGGIFGPDGQAMKARKYGQGYAENQAGNSAGFHSG